MSPTEKCAVLTDILAKQSTGLQNSLTDIQEFANSVRDNVLSLQSESAKYKAALKARKKPLSSRQKRRSDTRFENVSLSTCTDSLEEGTPKDMDEEEDDAEGMSE